MNTHAPTTAVNEDIEKTLLEIFDFCDSVEDLNKDDMFLVGYRDIERTLANVKEISLKFKKMKHDLFLLDEKKDNLTEDQIFELLDAKNKNDKNIETLIKRLTTFKRLDEGFKDILNIGIIQALEELEEIEVVKSYNNTNPIIPKCHPRDDEYICVCGKPHLKNLMVCSHHSLEYENFIIGSECVKHIEIFAMLQTCEETKNKFLNITDYFKTQNFKLTKKPCTQCNRYRVGNNNNYKGAESVKNRICTYCYMKVKIENEYKYVIKCNQPGCCVGFINKKYKTMCCDCWKNKN